MFSVFPVVALVLVNLFRRSSFVWILCVLAAAAANDLLEERFQRWLKRQGAERPARSSGSLRAPGGTPCREIVLVIPPRPARDGRSW